MKLKYAILGVLSLLLVTNCDAAITGIVVDADTGRPIEGAVILVEWVKAKGIPGLTSHYSYKVVEVVTDKEGKASIEGGFSLFADSPDVAVYKKGYVVWNNHYIFPDWKKRTDFKWKNNYVFKLEKFKPEYSYDKHQEFIYVSHNFGMASEKKQLFLKAYEWEKAFAREERLRQNTNKK